MNQSVVWVRNQGDEYEIACIDAVSGETVGDVVRVGSSGDALELPAGWGVPGGFRGAKVFLDIPLRDLHVRVLELSLADVEKVRNVLAFEAEGLFLLPLEDMVLDVETAGTVAAGTFRYILVGGEHALLKSHISRLGAAGLDPDMIGSSDLAILGKQTGEDDRTIRVEEILEPELTDRERALYVGKNVSSDGLSLRRGVLAETEKDRERNRMQKKVVVLAVVFLVLLMGNWGTRYVVVNAENTMLKNRIRTVYREIDPGAKNVRDEVYQAKVAIKNLRDRVEGLSGARSLEILMAVSEAKRDNPGIVLKEMQIRRNQVTATGEAPSFAGVESFGKAFGERSGGEARVLETSVIEEGRARFTVALSLNGEEGG